VSPGIFQVNGTSQGAILTPNYQLIDATHQAQAGDVIVIFSTGLGMTNPPVPSGVPSTAAQVTIPVTVTIGGVNAPVQYAGLSPGFVGLYQVNAVVPAGVTAGTAVPVVLTQGGVTSNQATIGVK